MNFHHKRFPIYNCETKSIEESQECIKIEKFFLDFYSLIEKQIYIEVERKEEFAPIKNKEGDHDTPKTAYKLYSDRNQTKIQDLESKHDEILQISAEEFMRDCLK